MLDYLKTWLKIADDWFENQTAAIQALIAVFAILIGITIFIACMCLWTTQTILVSFFGFFIYQIYEGLYEMYKENKNEYH